MGFFGWIRRKKAPGYQVAEPEALTEKSLDAQLTRTTRAIKESRLKYLRGRLEAINRKYEEMQLEEDLADAEDNLADMMGEDEESDADDLEGNFGKLIQAVIPAIPALSGRPAEVSQQPVPPSNDSSQPSDEELRIIKAQIPQAYQAKIKFFSDEQLLKFIQKYKPEYNAETISRAIKVLRE